MSHTKGPWKVWRHSLNKNEIYIEGANRRSVCYVIHNDNERKEQEADAALIAAAPQLYDVVAWLISERDNGTDKGLLPDGLLNAARVAIAKAEGANNA